MNNTLLDGFYLDGIRVVPMTGTIIRDDTTLHLPSKSAETLLWLARNPRRLVTREELLSHVWGEGHGTDEALNRAVALIRQALGDKPDEPHFLQTVPKRGYRLLVRPEPVRSDEPESAKDGDKPGRSLWQKLVRHGVVQAVAAYTLIGWALIQFAGETFPHLGFPAWTVRFVTFVVFGGFPVVVLLAWFLELSGGEMVLDEGQHEGSLWEGLGRNYLAIVAAYAVAAVGATVYQVSVGFAVPTNIPASAADLAENDNAVSDEQLLPVADNSVAVLRFANLDGNDITQVFANGLSEDLLDRIARLPGLLVSARGDSWSLPEHARSREVRKRLRVAFYVEGSVRIDDEVLTVVAQLIDSATGFHIESKSVRRTLTEFTEIQDEIASLIVAELRVALPEDIQLLTSLPVHEADVNAYVEFRRGKDIMDQPKTLESIQTAIAHFRAALSIDPDYAAAHAGLCRAYTARYEKAGAESDIGDAESACAAALAAGPRLALVHRASGHLYLQTSRLKDAERSYQIALDTNPRDADALLGLSRVFSRQHRLSEAEELVARAIELQPGNWRAYNRLGALHYRVGDYDKAVDAYRRVHFLHPDNFVVLGNLATASMMAGQFDAARKLFERTLEIEETPRALSNLGFLYYYLGNYEKSVELHRRCVELTPEMASAWINFADALLFSGREDEAAVAFQRGVELARNRNRTDPGNPVTLTYLAWSEAMTGNVAQARLLADHAIELAPEDPYSHYYRALIALQSGDRNTAMEAIATAATLGYPTAMLAAEPYLNPLKGRQEYVALLSGERGE